LLEQQRPLGQKNGHFRENHFPHSAEGTERGKGLVLVKKERRWGGGGLAEKLTHLSYLPKKGISTHLLGAVARGLTGGRERVYSESERNIHEEGVKYKTAELKLALLKSSS